MLMFESTWGEVSQVKAALSVIGRYRGVSQLYCRKSRFNGPLSRYQNSCQSAVDGVRSAFGQGGCTLRKGVFLPSKHLLSAFYDTPPSKNPSKNPCLY